MSIYNVEEHKAPSIFGKVSGLMTTVSKRYVAIKGQIARAYDRHLSERSASGSTLATWSADMVEAKQFDNKQKAMGNKASTAYKLYADNSWAFRSTVKEAVVEAMKRKNVGKAGLMAAIPHLDKLHTALGQARAQLTDLVYGAEPAVPFWVCYTLVGHQDNKDPIFQEQQIWTAEEFKQYAASPKFMRDAVKWAVGDAIQSETAPYLLLPDGFVGEAIEEVIDKGLEFKYESNVKDVEEGAKASKIWNLKGFYRGGVIGEMKDDMHVETVLAMVGRSVKAYNRVVGDITYRLANSMNKQTIAGLESADTVSDIGGCDITTSLNLDTGEVYIAQDGEFKDLTNDLENVTAAFEDYMAKWEKILPRRYLIATGTDYNGGYVMNEDNTFSKLAYELEGLDLYMDVDRFKEQAEKRKAYAIRAEAKRLEELAEQASPITF